MDSIDPEDLRCSIECCQDEYTTHLDLKRARELAKPAKVDEQVYELEEPIKVFLFDIPKAQYARRAMTAAIFAAANVVLGVVCMILFMFPFFGAYAEFSRNLHVPLCVIGMIYHVTPGMMAMCKFYDSSHVLKWIDRRSEHSLQMAVAFLFLFTGLGLFMWKGEPEFATLHAMCGLATVAANLVSLATGALACMGSIPGPKGSRGTESFMSNIHALIGIVTYAIYLVTFASGLQKALRDWLESIFGNWICFLLIGLTIFLYLVALIGPYLRRKANREKSKFESKLKKRRKKEEKDFKKREKMTKMGVSPEGLI